MGICLFNIFLWFAIRWILSFCNWCADVCTISSNVSLINDFKVVYDQQGSIGKRYYRQDEAGTPFCITVDHESKENNTVTLRNRDDQNQDRVPINDLKLIIQNRMDNSWAITFL